MQFLASFLSLLCALAIFAWHHERLGRQAAQDGQWLLRRANETLQYELAALQKTKEAHYVGQLEYCLRLAEFRNRELTKEVATLRKQATGIYFEDDSWRASLPVALKWQWPGDGS